MKDVIHCTSNGKETKRIAHCSLRQRGTLLSTLSSASSSAKCYVYLLHSRSRTAACLSLALCLQWYNGLITIPPGALKLDQTNDSVGLIRYLPVNFYDILNFSLCSATVWGGISSCNTHLSDCIKVNVK